MLLEQGADPLISDDQGNNALMIAVERGALSIVQRFLTIQEVKDNLRQTNNKGENVFIIADKKDNKEIIKLLQLYLSANTRTVPQKEKLSAKRPSMKNQHKKKEKSSSQTGESDKHATVTEKNQSGGNNRALAEKKDKAPKKRKQ